MQHQIKKSRKREGVYILVHESLDYKVRKKFVMQHDLCLLKYATEKLEIRYLKDLRNYKGKLFCSPQN